MLVPCRPCYLPHLTSAKVILPSSLPVSTPSPGGSYVAMTALAVTAVLHATCISLRHAAHTSHPSCRRSQQVGTSTHAPAVVLLSVLPRCCCWAGFEPSGPSGGKQHPAVSGGAHPLRNRRMRYPWWWARVWPLPVCMRRQSQNSWDGYSTNQPTLPSDDGGCTEAGTQKVQTGLSTSA